MQEKKWWESKKTLDMVFGVLALIASDKLGVSQMVMQLVAGLVGAKVAGQSFVDFKLASRKPVAPSD